MRGTSRIKKTCPFGLRVFFCGVAPPKKNKTCRTRRTCPESPAIKRHLQQPFKFMWAGPTGSSCEKSECKTGNRFSPGGIQYGVNECKTSNRQSRAASFLGSRQKNRTVHPDPTIKAQRVGQKLVRFLHDLAILAAQTVLHLLPPATSGKGNPRGRGPWFGTPAYRLTGFSGGLENFQHLF